MAFSKLFKLLLFPFRLLKWLVLLAVTALVAMAFFSTPADAVLLDSDLSEAQRGAISQNCATIKQSLRNLQKADIRTRTYLGSTYETVFNDFILPLNRRLLENNIVPFSGIQSDFSTEQAAFRSAYTTYMRSLETLIATDCQTKPDAFYDQLLKVRAERADLRLATERLNDLTSEQYQSALKLKENL